MELILTMSSICIGILLLMWYLRIPQTEPKSMNGDSWTYPKFLIVAFAFVLIFVSAFRVGFQDTGVYKNLYEYIGCEYSNAFDDSFVIKDTGFNLFMVFLNRINSDPQTLIIVSSVVTLTVYVYVITKLSTDLTFSLLLMLCATFIGTMNGIRQILAGVIILLGWPLLKRKKVIPFVLLVLIASTFHASAIILAPLSLIICGKRYNKGIGVFVVFIVFCFAFPDAANRILGTVLEDSVYEKYLEEEAKMGIVRLIVECVPVIISLLYNKVNPRRKAVTTVRTKDYDNQRMIDILMNMQLISLGFTALGLQMVYFARISMYFSLVLPILLPTTISGAFTEKSAKTVKHIAIFMYLLYFAYQIYTYEMIDHWGGMKLIF